MSAYAYIGLQGSGKTLKAVSKLYDNFINEKTKEASDYDYALTNINEFDFSKSDKIKPLDFDDLYSKLLELYNISVVQKKTDTELNKRAKEYNLFNCLIVIDEAPHYFTKDRDNILLWWIEYHRHMYQDIILITPNKARFRTEYRNSIHYFVKSVSAKYRLKKNVYRYAVFSNYNMNKDDFEHFESFKVKNELFKLYQSGKSINGTPVIYYYVVVIVIILILLFLFSSSFLNRFEPKKDIKKEPSGPVPANKKTNKNQSKKKVINTFYYGENERLYKIKCSNKLCFIILDDIVYEFPFLFIDNLIKHTSSNKLDIQESKTFTTFYLLTNKNNFNFIIKENQHKGVKNGEDKNKTDDNLFSIGNK